jgi:siroheme synthase-like protein
MKRRASVDLFPIFLKLAGRKVVIVGGGLMAASKLRGLRECDANVTVIAPEICAEIARSGVSIVRRGFREPDLDGAWLAIAAATPEVNRVVAEAAGKRRLFLNAVDDPENASAFMGAVVRKGSVGIAISTNGEAPALAGLIREALEELLPREIATWTRVAKRLRVRWRQHQIAMESRRPLLLIALNELYARKGVLASVVRRHPRAISEQEPERSLRPAEFR